MRTRLTTTNRRPLRRLARDTAGNTLAMMAAAMIPVTALAGSAVDTARLYVVKVRLQQACDAGVLAGRKFMESNNQPALDDKAKTQANAFFNNNFRSNWMQTKAVAFNPTKTADQQVAGTATATVAMTVMKMFAAPDVKLNVVCEARFDVADADIMFVLDTTGSMSCTASDPLNCSGAAASYTRAAGSTGYYATEKSGSKIAAVRQAVLDFYDTMADNADPSTHLRYGFVPYSSNVNVGRIIPAGGLWNGNYTYSSRRIWGEQNNGNAATVTLSGYTNTNCGTANGRYPGPDKMVRQGWTTSGTAYYLTAAAWSNNACTATRQNVRIVWFYGNITYPMADFVAGRDVVDPTLLTGALSDKWRGCIEERSTTASGSFDIDNLPPDLDPDLPATSLATMWRPSWPDAIWRRYGPGEGTSTSATDNIGDSTSLASGFAPCGQQARRLGMMSRSDVQNYLSASGDFRPHGGTYHDVGMIWGTRMLSPKGVFADDTKAWPGRNEPNRHIIFMTDGAMSTNLQSYGLYGIEESDRRVTGTDTSTQLDRHNARFVAECQAARARNITVWVIAFSQQLNDQLRDCATQDNNHVFFASDDVTLKAAFTTIAKQVALLRVSK